MSLEEKDKTAFSSEAPTRVLGNDSTPRHASSQVSVVEPREVVQDYHESTPRHASSKDSVAGPREVAQGHLRDANLDNSPQSSVQRPQSLAGEIFFIAVICSSQLLTQAGLALSIAPQNIIARSFGIQDNPGEVSWFSAGYSLTAGTLILIAGRLGDVFGHKRFFVGGFAWFGVWSAIAGCAVYAGPVFFAFCRAMQGIGPAFVLPNSIAILGRCYDPGMRLDIIFSLFGATAPSGFLLGALFASLLSQLAWWPWAFWVMACACLLVAVLGIFAIPVTPPPHDPEHEGSSVWQKVDIFGCIAGVAALVLFNFAWNQGPAVGWTVPYTYCTMILGVVFFLGFILVERLARHPLIPFGVLKPESFLTLACVGAGWSSFGIFVYYIWSFLMNMRHQTPLLTSAQFAPVAISGLLAAVTTGAILGRFRPSTVMLISMTAFLVAGIVFGTVPVRQTYWAQTLVAIIVFPWGMDMSFPAATIVLSRAMPKKHQGLAASLVNTIVNYSMSIGLGFAGTVDSQLNDGGNNLLRGLRGAFAMGVGLAALGVVVALIFCFAEQHRTMVSEKGAQETSQTDMKSV